MGKWDWLPFIGGNDNNGNQSPPPSKPIAVSENLTIADSITGKGILNARVTISPDDGSGPFISDPPNPNAYYHIPLSDKATVGWGYSIEIKADGYVTYNGRGTVKEGDNNTDPISLSSAVSYPFPPETGNLRVDGTYFKTVDSQFKFLKGISQFTLFNKYRKGENIEPNLVWARKYGFNLLEVMGPLDWPETPEYRSMGAGDWNTLINFFTLCSSYGLRVEWIPITGKSNSADHRYLVENSINAAKQCYNVNIEICNEPDKDGKCNPISLLSGIDTGNLLISYGKYPSDSDSWTNYPVAKYGTIHFGRDLPKAARKGKDLLELRNALGKPWISNEPLGINEVEQPGRRTTNLDYLVADCAISMMFGNGWTYHFEDGLHANIPAPGSIQEQGAQRLLEVFKFLDGPVNTGAYVAPHLIGYPLEYKDGDSQTDHAYAVILGNLAFACVPLPRSGYIPAGKDGWTVTNSLYNCIFRLTR